MYHRYLKLLHKPLLTIMKSRRKFDLRIIDSKNLPDFSPVIYVVNHTNSYDVPVVSEVIKKHFHIIVGKQPLNATDRIAFNLNGAIWIDRKNSDSKHLARIEIEKCLKDKANILLFPEGTWNRSPNKIMLPLYWGVIDIAKSCNVPICPIVLDYASDVCFAKVGKIIKIDQYKDKSIEIKLLRDVMATLKWEIWESQPKLKRSEIDERYFENLLSQEVKEYPKIDLEYEHSVVLKQFTESEEAFLHLKALNPRKQNAFLFNKRLFY